MTTCAGRRAHRFSETGCFVKQLTPLGITEHAVSAQSNQGGKQTRAIIVRPALGDGRALERRRLGIRLVVPSCLSLGLVLDPARIGFRERKRQRGSLTRRRAANFDPGHESEQWRDRLGNLRTPRPVCDGTRESDRRGSSASRVDRCGTLDMAIFGQREFDDRIIVRLETGGPAAKRRLHRPGASEGRVLETAGTGIGKILSRGFLISVQRRCNRQVGSGGEVKHIDARIQAALLAQAVLQFGIGLLLAPLIEQHARNLRLHRRDIPLAQGGIRKRDGACLVGKTQRLAITVEHQHL